MDTGLLELAVVIIPIFIVSIPRILLKHFSNSNIPINFDKFNENYKDDIRKIEKHGIEKLCKMFDEAINSTLINNENDRDENDRDKDFIKQLYANEAFFVELRSHNIKSYKYNKIKGLYDSIKHYNDNFNRFYYMATAIAIITLIVFFLFNFDIPILIIILLVAFFLIAESIRNLYYLAEIQRKIDKIIESIQEDIKHIPKHNLIE